MWKLILALVLVVYLLNKVAVILYRVMGRPQSPPQFQSRHDGSIHVDKQGKPSTKRGDIKGGEYVDYEEVK